MALNLEGYEKRVSEAVKSFWKVRKTSGVRSGKTLDAFVELLTWIIKNNGLPDAVVVTGRQAQLPGFFRASKSWDVLVMHNGILIAAIELKSIADSFGKNANNRNEEAIGSGIDLKEASAIKDGEYGVISKDTSIKAFLASLASHVETIVAIESA